MKTLALFIILISTTSFGQTIIKVQKDFGEYFVVDNLDSLDIKSSLPNGQYRVYYQNDTSRIRYLFNLSNNKVTGFFLSYYENGKWASVGTYDYDSLWTFRKDSFEHIDTSFKIACWRYQTKFSYPNEGRAMVEEKTYRIPFEESKFNYIDSWYYPDNSLLSVRHYNKLRGLTQEVWFHSNGQISSEKTFTKNYRFEVTKTNDELINKIYLKQNLSYYISLGLDTTEISYDQTISVTDSNDKVIAYINLDKGNEKVSSIFGNGVNMFLDKDNKRTIYYWNDRGKFKMRTLK